MFRWFSKLFAGPSLSAMIERGLGEGITVDPGKPEPSPFVRPFNIYLYAQSAEEGLRRIRDAIGVGEDGLRDIAGEELEDLKKRYRHNGYLRVPADQRAEAQEVCVCTAPPIQPCGPYCEYPYPDCCGTTAACCKTGGSEKWVGPRD